MLKEYKIYKKELQRVKSEEVYFKNHDSLWSYFFKWKKLIHSNSVEARLPWISFPVISFLEDKVKPQSKVFEYGGGGSSLFFVDKGAQVYTVEHNKEWFGILSKKLEVYKNWKGVFVLPEEDEKYVSDFSNPDLYFSSEKDFEGKNFKKYASAIDSYEGFDFVLVDGRARPSCMKHGIAKLNKGGYLILDNSDRAYYTKFFTEQLKKDFVEIINYSGPTPFCSWFNRTSVWQKK
jgi:hypothetical protein